MTRPHALVDSHCHLDVTEFDDDRDAVIERARAAGVCTQVIPGIALSGFEKIRSLCASNVGLLPAYGLHPLLITEHRLEHLTVLRHWLEREGAVAVGECGLDFHVENLDADLQRHYFNRQLELAREFELPLIVHARRAVEEVTLALRNIGGLRGVIHSFSGSQQQAEQLWKLGFFIGIGGPVTYPRARRLREIVAHMPLEYLLLETDSPDQPLHGQQGQRNEPARILAVLEVIAELRGVDSQAIAAATTANAARLFERFHRDR